MPDHVFVDLILMVISDSWFFYDFQKPRRTGTTPAGRSGANSTTPRWRRGSGQIGVRQRHISQPLTASQNLASNSIHHPFIPSWVIYGSSNIFNIMFPKVGFRTMARLIAFHFHARYGESWI
jgi:hypothetical protein